MAQFSDPHQQDKEVYNGRSKRYTWFEGYSGVGTTAVDVILGYATGHDLRALTYGQLVNALIGVNQIRLAYPKLDMCCNISNEDNRKQPALWVNGMIVLTWERNP